MLSTSGSGSGVSRPSIYSYAIAPVHISRGLSRYNLETDEEVGINKGRREG